jgi:hypothetical protein
MSNSDYAIILLDENDNPVKRCHCDLFCFKYVDCTTGRRVYKCPVREYTYEDHRWRPTGQIKCDFYEELYEFTPRFDNLPPEKTTPNKRRSKPPLVHQLQEKCSQFLLTRSYHTFQEIEMLCKQLGKPLFDPNVHASLHQYVTDIVISRRMLHSYRYN